MSLFMRRATARGYTEHGDLKARSRCAGWVWEKASKHSLKQQ
jgi:hypothetical protein